ncbi:hypothetical protein [Rhodococcus erythropolis]|uniref:hypothetical protein n=1 Tax=Rhodococcus erythropolis TaxID=1833 RepID=UPI00211A628D|nr:hypothetical protein [Rhodococcus erythropolis]
MSAITDYFTARTDEHATSALEGLVDLEPAVIEANDASRPRIQLAADGTPVLQAKGVDPVVALGSIQLSRSADWKQPSPLAPTTRSPRVHAAGNSSQ